MAEPANPDAQTHDDADHAKKPRLEYSSRLGPPSIVFDPDDIKNARMPFPDTAPRIRAVDNETLVKFGKYVRLQEAEAMDFVREQTNIAVPKVLSAYVLDGIGYIVMSWEDATPLRLFWEKASRADQDAVIAKLSAHMAEMRALKGDYIGGFGGNACVDEEFQWDFDQSESHAYGPYADEAAFNEGLIEATTRNLPIAMPQDPESCGYNEIYKRHELIRSLRGHDIVFTHGDLHAWNILVAKDLSIVIVDWSQAGFYPAYWEFYKATWRDTFKPSFIREVVKYIPPFWIEANIMLQVYCTILG